MSKRRKWSATEKFKIALEAIIGESTLNAICKRYAVAPCQVHAWKKQLLEEGAQLFSKSGKSSTKPTDAERKQSQLYEKIGQLTMERDYLKKVWGKFHENNDES